MSELFSSGLELRDLHNSSVPLAQSVAEQVEEAILRRQLPAGTHLGTKAQLQKEWGVAMGTLTEAIRLLQRQGTVEVRPGPGGGLFVASNSSRVRIRHGVLQLHRSARSVAECIAVRDALEGLVAMEAAARRTDEDIRSLEQILEQMAGAVERPTDFVRANWALHRRIAECGANAVLISVYRLLLDMIETSLDSAELEDTSQDQIEDTLATHRRLVDAVISGDIQQAADAAHEHTPEVAVLDG